MTNSTSDTGNSFTDIGIILMLILQILSLLAAFWQKMHFKSDCWGGKLELEPVDAELKKHEMDTQRHRTDSMESVEIRDI